MATMKIEPWDTVREKLTPTRHGVVLEVSEHTGIVLVNGNRLFYGLPALEIVSKGKRES